MSVNKIVTKVDGVENKTIDFNDLKAGLGAGAHTITVEAYNGATLVSTQTKNITIAAPSSIDSSLQAVLDYADTQGFAKPTGAILTALNELVVDIKGYGLFSRMDGFFNFAYFSNSLLQPFSRICFKRLILSTISGNVTYSASGFKGGTNGFINLFFNPQTTNANGYYKQNLGGRGAVVYSQATSANKVIDGEIGEYNNIMLGESSTVQRINSGSISTAIDFGGTGLMSLNRLDATNLEGFNKAVKTTSTAASKVPVSQEISLFRNVSNYGNTGTSMYYFGDRFTAAEVTNLRTAYNKYLLAIGLTQYA